MTHAAITLSLIPACGGPSTPGLYTGPPKPQYWHAVSCKQADNALCYTTHCTVLHYTMHCAKLHTPLCFTVQ